MPTENNQIWLIKMLISGKYASFLHQNATFCEVTMMQNLDSISKSVKIAAPRFERKLTFETNVYI